MLDAVLEDWTTADIPDRTRAALTLLEYMTVHPMDIDADFVQTLFEKGLDDLSMREAANVGFHYNMINRVADAVDFPMPEGVKKKRLAKLLNFSSKMLKGSVAEQAWVQGEDGYIRPPEVENGRSQLLTAPGTTTPDTRRCVEAFVIAQWDYHRSECNPIAEELEPFLKKLSLHAYKITDENVCALQDAGYSNEALYELIMVGSVGAALVGLEKLYGAMYGSHLPKELGIEQLEGK